MIEDEELPPEAEGLRQDQAFRLTVLEKDFREFQTEMRVRLASLEEAVAVLQGQAHPVTPKWEDMWLKHKFTEDDFKGR